MKSLVNLKKGETVKPLFDRVLVKMDMPDEKVGSLYVPAQALDHKENKPRSGEVIAAGPGYDKQRDRVEDMCLKVGDRVILSDWGGKEFDIDGIDHICISQLDVFCKIDKK